MPQAEPTPGRLRAALADVIRLEREVQVGLRQTIAQAEQAIRESEERVNLASHSPTAAVAPDLAPATQAAPAAEPDSGGPGLDESPPVPTAPETPAA